MHQPNATASTTAAPAARLAATLLGALLVALPGAAGATATTQSIASMSVSIGGVGDYVQVTDGPAARPTSVNGLSRLADPSSSNSVASSLVDAESGYGRLRARATVDLYSATNAAGLAGDGFAEAPSLAASFADQVVIGGGGGEPHLFRLHFALSGRSGLIGPADMLWGARLSVQAWGTGISVVGGPDPTGFVPFPYRDVYSVGAFGTTVRTISVSDTLYISAVDGSTMNLNGSLGAYLLLRDDTSTTPQSSIAVLDLWNTGTFSIEALSPGTTFTSASGHDYLAAAVPEPSAALLLLAALPLVGWAVKRRAAAPV
jgi:hypothetical protein